MPIVDNPTIPRVGECERKAAFIPLVAGTGQGDPELEEGPVGGQGEHLAVASGCVAG
jgi:hypothetical protein